MSIASVWQTPSTSIGVDASRLIPGADRFIRNATISTRT
jgi:hypothetical protein